MFQTNWDEYISRQQGRNMWIDSLGEMQEANSNSHLHCDFIKTSVHFALFFGSHQYVKPMNFQEEVRAHRDLDSFLAQASILLDEKATTLDEVLRRMIADMVEGGHESCDVDQVMNSLFTDAGGKEFNGEENISEVHYKRKCWLLMLTDVSTLKL